MRFCGVLFGRLSSGMEMMVSSLWSALGGGEVIANPIVSGDPRDFRRSKSSSSH